LIDCDWLDPDPCFVALGTTTERRHQRYRDFVAHGIHEHELKFIRGAVSRNQLTGSEAFVLEIERRTGERILCRSRGRPRVE
jgi:putative transposase